MTGGFADRIAEAQKEMKQYDCDVLVVTNRENLIYFTGITQIECLAVVIPREGEACAIALWLDADYVRDKSGLTTYAYFFPRKTLGSTIVERIQKLGMADPKIGFERYFVDYAVYDALRSSFSERNFKGVGELFYKLRSVKDESEIEKLRKAGKAACAGMEAAIKAIRPGIRELDVLAEAEYAMLKAGSWGNSFRPQVVSGDRTILAHPTASDKVIESGEIVVVHLSATFEGYCSKMARTAAMGRIIPESIAVYELLLTALRAAESALRPGASSDDVDAAARKLVEEAGFGNAYLDTVGYGVGLRQSEFYPMIGKGRTERIETNMVVDLLLPTIYRKGIGGPRVTDVIRVGEKENELLTNYSRDLVII